MGELKDQIAKLERATGTTGKGQQKTRQVIIRGAHGLLWLYTIGEGGKIVREQTISEEEAAKLCGSPEEQARRSIRYNTLSTAQWRMEHWPEKYPTMAAALAYGSERDNRYGEDDELYDQVYDELLSTEGVSRG